MGIDINQHDSKFFIALENKQAALKVGRPIHGHWVKEGEGKKCRTLEDLFELWGYEPTTDDDGNITDLQLNQEKMGAEFELFKAIAPFVKPKSFLKMSSDGEVWRWQFDGTTCIEKYAKVTWDE